MFSTRNIGKTVKFNRNGKEQQGINPGFARADRSEAVLVAVQIKSTEGTRIERTWVATDLVTLV